MAVVTALWNGFAFAVLCAPQYSDGAIDADAGLFNYAIVIMAGITVVGLEEWWRKSKHDWFRNLDGPDGSSPDSEAKHHEGKGASPFLSSTSKV